MNHFEQLRENILKVLNNYIKMQSKKYKLNFKIKIEIIRYQLQNIFSKVIIKNLILAKLKKSSYHVSPDKRENCVFRVKYRKLYQE